MVERSRECCLHVEGLNKTSGLASYKDFFFFWRRCQPFFAFYLEAWSELTLMIVINMSSTFCSNSLPGEFLTSTNLSHAALRQCLALPR